jgi:hypothetical protein
MRCCRTELAPTGLAGAEENRRDLTSLKLRAFAKRLPQRSELLWVDLFFENREALGLRDVSAEITEFSCTKLYDFTNDPFSEDGTRRALRIGGICAEGISRAREPLEVEAARFGVHESPNPPEPEQRGNV